MEAIWYLDRAAGLLSYPALYMAVVTGILYNTPAFGRFHEAARRVHIEVSVFAMLVTLLHAGLGVLDTWLVVTGQVPQPAYSTGYLLAGVAVGTGALLLLVVAVLGFVDARRFEHPWSPRVVHTFAYGGFAFGTIHAVAVGTDVGGLARPVLAATTGFLVYVLLLRLLEDHDLLPGGTADGQ
ncbi:hypothetical protein [Haloglomus salinum]|jgi:hypothetical protein|uniref:hypothetical protein n=1 Tax=Haloglomus salinum TaxID=2962673 RepID=UPI0020CA0C1C|nr:hypothetical protein [Haloglomus salinum]